MFEAFKEKVKTIPDDEVDFDIIQNASELDDTKPVDD
jgi:hypothetical protein